MAGLFDILAPALQIGSTVLSAGAQLSRGNAAAQVGRRRQQLAKFEADQLEQEAGQSEAVSQRNAEDVGRQVKLINSAAIARAAASGASASDPTVKNIIAQTSAEGAYRQALALYEGEAQARLDRMRASALRFQGNTELQDAENAQRASRFGAAATFLSGGAQAGSLYDKYYAGPKRNTASGSASLPVLDAGIADTLTG